MCDIIIDLLEKTESIIQNMVKNIEKSHIKKEGKPFTSFEKELCKLSLIYDMVRSFEKYTAPSDILEDFKVYNSPKGVTIYANIIRNNISYTFSTDVIIAGGYNIQTMHYRYITSTKLPKTNGSIISNKYCAEIKAMKKIEKYNNEILYFEKVIDELKTIIDNNTKLTDDDIFEKIKTDYLLITWEDIVKRGADKNYDSRENFEKIQKIEKLRSISSWKMFNITWKLRSITDYNNKIKKNKDKIKKIENNK